MIEKGKKLVCSSKECGFVCSMPEDAKEKRELPGESVYKNKEEKNVRRYDGYDRLRIKV